MRAASSSSSGMLCMNCRIRKIPNALAAPGRITPQ